MLNVATTRMYSKGQVVIPEDIRKQLRLKADRNSWSWARTMWKEGVIEKGSSLRLTFMGGM